MTIQEAIESGVPFRRRGHNTQFMFARDGLFFWEWRGTTYMLSPEDVLAKDWEVRREPREFLIGFDAGGVICGVKVVGSEVDLGAAEIVHVREIQEK